MPRKPTAANTKTINIQTSVPSLLVPEGGQATFGVKLSARPRNEVTVNVARKNGDADITVTSGASLRFNKFQYDQWQTVTLAAAKDADAVSGDAVFSIAGKNLVTQEVRAVEKESDQTPEYGIITDSDTVTVAEGANATFNVKLSDDPGEDVAVTVGHHSGDPNIAVWSGATLTFVRDKWNTYQPVILSAAENSDTVNGEAVFAVSAPNAPAVYVTATEQDNDSSSTPSRVVIDPVSRIEGHLRVEVEVSGGQVTKAWSSATLFRGIEKILAGRDPRDAPLITQRLCGVCTYVHQLCSVRAIENAIGLDSSIPDNARLVRNLTLGAQFMHDHVVHFFHLHGLDWVDITSAIKAKPSATEILAAEVTPDAAPIDFAAVKSRLLSLVDTDNLGPFANAYWGHSDYNLTPEQNLLVTAHYLSALDLQIDAARMMAILGGKNPHPQSTIVGGVTCGGELSPGRLADFRSYLNKTLDFVENVYIPDLKVVAASYPDWKGIGGFNNFLACGEFPQSANFNDLFMPSGVILNGAIHDVQPLDESDITEHVAHSWYSGTTDLHPLNGETNPAFTGLNVDDRYSWFKAPRYNGKAMEVGPLARVLVGYGKGETEFVTVVNEFLGGTGLEAADLFSTLGRTAARALETVIIGRQMGRWLDDLEGNLESGDKKIYTDYVMATDAGRGFLEAPRGALGHWIDINNSTTNRYQMVVPTTWNLGPRCANSIPGPMEQALVGVPVADSKNPVEILRVIHSFDPCIACGVHVIDVDQGKTYDVKVI